MIRFFKIVFVFVMSLTIFSCNKVDDPVEAYVVPYAEQYPKDLLAIETFLHPDGAMRQLPPAT